MTGDLFDEWIYWFDAEFSRSNSSRKVLVFMENVSMHTAALKAIELLHTKAIMLPKNSTSHSQPLDAGIIQNIKMHYRA